MTSWAIPYFFSIYINFIRMMIIDSNQYILKEKMIFLLSKNGRWIIWVIFLTCILIGFLRYRLFEGTKSTKWAEDYGRAKISAESNTFNETMLNNLWKLIQICKYEQIHFCSEILWFKLVIFIFGPEILNFFSGLCLILLPNTE